MEFCDALLEMENDDNTISRIAYSLVTKKPSTPMSRDFVFQQDGAPPHSSLQLRAFLNEEVPQRWICRKSAQDSTLCAWNPRSPDITPCDFYLWGYIKDNVYVPPLPTTLDDLIEQIKLSGS